MSNSRDIESTKQQLEENTELLGTFKFLPKLEKKVKAYESLCKEKIEVDVAIQDLYRCFKKVQELQVDVESYSDLLELEDKMIQAQNAVTETKKCAVQIKTISFLIAEITGHDETYKKLESLITIEPKVKEAIKLVETISAISKLIKATEHVTDKANMCDAEIGEMETEYIETMPEECPLCGHAMLEE